MAAIHGRQIKEKPLKKGIVVVLLVLALVVIVSPRLVGHLAEKSVDENLNWAADNSSELIIASEGFDRGWFSSQGQHRIELGEGTFRGVFESMLGDGDTSQIPALLINTRMDHGLIPVSSMSREGGSLAPGLGSAVSTLIFERGDGEQIEIPGKILSTVGLSGNVQSNYVLEEGAQAFGDGNLSWKDTDIKFSVDPNSGESVFDGVIDALSFSESQVVMSISDVEFSGETSSTPFGFSVGEANASIGDLTIPVGASQSMGLEKFDLQTHAKIDGDRVDSEATINVVSKTFPGFGEVSIVADIRAESDAAATGALSKAMQGTPDSADPMELLESTDTELKNYLAGGMNIDVEKLNITLPMGEIKSQLHFSVPKAKADDFDYSSLLLSAEAEFNIEVPEALVDMAIQMSPEVGMVVALGYLKQNGSVYELDAKMKNGLLTLNGAPTTIPFGLLR